MVALREFFATIINLFRFFWSKKRWWLLPMIVALVIVAGLIILGSAAGIGPIIYTLF